MTDYSPWAHVQGLAEVLVAYDELEHAHAYWEPDARVILLDRRLSQAERRWHLAHELAHLDRADECCEHGPDAGRQATRQERHADELAARRLISLEQLAAAVVWAASVDEAAEVLGVPAAAVRVRLDHLHPAERGYLKRRLSMKEHTA